MALQDRPAGTGPAVDLGCAPAASEDGRGLVIGLAGELDLAGADALVALVVCLCADGQRMLVVDLAGLNFVDVAGLQALRSARRVAAGYRARVTLTGARPPARRLLALRLRGQGSAVGRSPQATPQVPLTAEGRPRTLRRRA